MKGCILRALEGTDNKGMKNTGVDALSCKGMQECCTFILTEGSLICVFLLISKGLG